LKTFAPKLYEAMFLVDSAKAAADWDGILGTITSLLGKCDAEILSLKKWDERRLAYDISRQSRGTYILCYFNGDGQKIGDLERSVQLSEEILRVLILRGDHVKPEDIEKDTPSTRVEKAQQAAEETAEAKAEAKEAAVAEEATEAKDAVVSEESVEANEAVVSEDAAEANVEPDETVVAADSEEPVEAEEIASSEEEPASVEISEEAPAVVDTEGLTESTEEAEDDDVPDIFAIGPEVYESEETEKPSE
jgi:small subunit ribosomal protein S6